MRHATTAGRAEDDRCRRCDIWPDQRTAVSGDWLIYLLRLCPRRLEQVFYWIEHGLVRNLGEQREAILQLSQRWPQRGLFHTEVRAPSIPSPGSEPASQPAPFPELLLHRPSAPMP
ncbi:hypothetical protein [Muricoccus aerilatus]|uniref:hypothetical protein n=1 Tax=Muricoccus aerilatus TaxID=452982 RepID=UPI0005C2498E|nr:hypothetical protein [Roseomonas aerilata]